MQNNWAPVCLTCPFKSRLSECNSPLSILKVLCLRVERYIHICARLPVYLWLFVPAIIVDRSWWSVCFGEFWGSLEILMAKWSVSVPQHDGHRHLFSAQKLWNILKPSSANTGGVPPERPVPARAPATKLSWSYSAWQGFEGMLRWNMLKAISGLTTSNTTNLVISCHGRLATNLNWANDTKLRMQ